MGFEFPHNDDAGGIDSLNSTKESCDSCSICLELVVFDDGRSCVKLICGHEFHLDCIGSAFNSRGAMQCPNCRNIEQGQWLYGSGRAALDDSHDEEFYDLSYSEMSLGVRWCPFIYPQPSSSYEEREYPSSAYRDLLGRQALLAERASVSYYGPVHSPSASTRPIVSQSAYNNHWSTTLSGLNEAPTSYSFPSMNPHYLNWEHHSSSPLPAVNNRLGNADQPVRSVTRPPGFYMHPSLAGHSSSTRASNNIPSAMIPPYPGSGGRTRDHIQAVQAHFQLPNSSALLSASRHSGSHRSSSPFPSSSDEGIDWWLFEDVGRGTHLGNFEVVDLTSHMSVNQVEREPDWGFFGSRLGNLHNGSDPAPSQDR